MDIRDQHCSKYQCKNLIIVTSIWMVNFFSVFVLKSMGVLLPSLLAQFEALTSNVGVTVSLVFVCGNAIAIFAQSLTKILNARVIIICCGILTTVGLVISSLANGMTALVLGMALTGFSNMANVIAFGIIPQYFPTDSDIIINIVATALPVAIMVSSPITQLLIDLYGWRGCLLLTSGIMCNIIPCAILLRPLKQISSGYVIIPGDSNIDKNKHGNITGDSNIDQNKPCYTTGNSNINKNNHGDITGEYNIGKSKAGDTDSGSDSKQICAVFTSSSFMLIHILSFVDGFDLNGWVVYLVSIIQNKGIASNEAARIASYSGIGCFLVRVILAITQGKSKNYRLLFTISSLFLVTSYGGMYLTSSDSSSSWILLSVFSIALGTGHGILGCQIYNAAASIAGGNTVIAVAWIQLLASIAYTISGYLSGLLKDTTGTFQMTLILQCSMSSLIIAAVTIPYLWSFLNKSAKNL